MLERAKKWPASRGWFAGHPVNPHTRRLFGGAERATRFTVNDGSPPSCPFCSQQAGEGILSPPQAERTAHPANPKARLFGAHHVRLRSFSLKAA